jgi:hypothetical protein
MAADNKMETLISIKQTLTPGQQEKLDKLSPRQKQALAALVDERLNGDKGNQWLADNFHWVWLQVTKYVP